MSLTYHVGYEKNLEISFLNIKSDPRFKINLL